MSSSELVSLFPTPTHPALPLAAQILSTLRTLTAPGKGNDLKPEERAALVGISALIGCERVQSKDLPLSSAQKASSVSPSHFRSALTHCRRILSSLPAQPTASTSSSPSSSRRSPRSNPPTSSLSTHAEDEAGTSSAAGPSPFQTPKKKFKYTSGVDISGLVKQSGGGGSTSKAPGLAQGAGARGLLHTPVKGSPLKNSVTPSSSRIRRVADDSEAGAERAGADDGIGIGGGGGEEEEVGTPTKKVKFGVKQGVDLERVELGELGEGSRGKRKREDVSAFLAMRPGGSRTRTDESDADEARRRAAGAERLERAEMDGWEADRRTRRKKDRAGRPKGRNSTVQQKRDWTYAESSPWTGGTEAEARKALDEVWSDLTAWLEARKQPFPPPSNSEGKTVEEVFLMYADPSHAHAEAMEVDPR